MKFLKKTEGYEGFFHLHSLKAAVDHSSLEYIIRDHDRKRFEERKQTVLQTVEALNKQLGKALISVEIKDQYYNMLEKIEPVMEIVDIAEMAMKAVGVQPLIKAIRGGTDGSQLSYMGLPCPNIFAGGHNFHRPIRVRSVGIYGKSGRSYCKNSRVDRRKIKKLNRVDIYVSNLSILAASDELFYFRS